MQQEKDKAEAQEARAQQGRDEPETQAKDALKASGVSRQVLCRLHTPVPAFDYHYPHATAQNLPAGRCRCKAARSMLSGGSAACARDAEEEDVAHCAHCVLPVRSRSCSLFPLQSGLCWHAWICWCVMQLQDVDGGQEQASAKDQAEGRQASSPTPQSSQVYFAANDVVMQVFLQAER